MTFCLYLGTLSSDLTRGVSPEELLLYIYQLLAVSSLLYLAQSPRITIYILIDFPPKELGSHFIIPIYIACHCTQEFITCLTAILFLLERFHSWNCLMDLMLHSPLRRLRCRTTSMLKEELWPVLLSRAMLSVRFELTNHGFQLPFNVISSGEC